MGLWSSYTLRGKNSNITYIYISLLHFFTSCALSWGGVGGPDPSSPKVSVVCIFWHHPQFPHVPVHKIAPSPSGSASWSPSGDLHVHHLSGLRLFSCSLRWTRPNHLSLLSLALLYTPYPQLFSGIFTLHYVFHCHPP